MGNCFKRGEKKISDAENQKRKDREEEQNRREEEEQKRREQEEQKRREEEEQKRREQEEQRADEEIEENRKKQQILAQQEFDKAHEDLMKAFDDLDAHLDKVNQSYKEARLRKLEQQDQE